MHYLQIGVDNVRTDNVKVKGAGYLGIFISVVIISFFAFFGIALFVYYVFPVKNFSTDNFGYVMLAFMSIIYSIILIRNMYSKKYEYSSSVYFSDDGISMTFFGEKWFYASWNEVYIYMLTAIEFKSGPALYAIFSLEPFDISSYLECSAPSFHDLNGKGLALSIEAYNIEEKLKKYVDINAIPKWGQLEKKRIEKENIYSFIWVRERIN